MSLLCKTAWQPRSLGPKTRQNDRLEWSLVIPDTAEAGLFLKFGQPIRIRNSLVTVTVFVWHLECELICACASHVKLWHFGLLRCTELAEGTAAEGLHVRSKHGYRSAVTAKASGCV